MDEEIDPKKLATMRKRIMDLERINAFTGQYKATEMQRMIKNIIEEVAFDDN